MEQTPNLTKAIIAVMKEVKGIDKTMTVGTGNSSYKGVPDQEVKKIIGAAMEKNGLCIIPVDINAKTQIDRWEESYNGQVKQKQSVFTEVTTKYLLMHESGESREISGYGHGVDSQDKGAGKATTYALKYTLLYLFLTPTGKIDDSDNTHSESYDVAHYDNYQQWKDELSKCKTKADVVYLFNKNKETVQADTVLKGLFKSRQNAVK
jgi:hypothetical protein